MSLLSKRLVSIATSTLVLSLVSAAAHADLIDVLTARNPNDTTYMDGAFGASVSSTYTFNTSMILNSVGFVTDWHGSATPSYTLEYAISSVNNGAFQSVLATDQNLSSQSGNIRWFSLSNAVTLNSTDIVTVRTTNTANIMGLFTSVQKFGDIDSNVNVSVVRNDKNFLGANFSNSNLRVTASNPGSNVAPEPGSFALALTGGAALLGIFVRRRRNAG